MPLRFSESAPTNGRLSHAAAPRSLARSDSGVQGLPVFPSSWLITGPKQFGINRPVQIGRPSLSILIMSLRASSTPECRRDSDVLRGCAVQYNVASSDSRGGDVPCLFLPGCFGKSLFADLRLTFNFNNPNFILGRVAAHTFQLTDGPDQLSFECFPPACSWSADLIVSIQRGDITGVAVACEPTSSSIESYRGQKIRAIKSAILRGIAVSSFSAFDSSIDVKPIPPVGGEGMASYDKKFLRSVGIQAARV
jgi:phage head maturation protease